MCRNYTKRNVLAVLTWVGMTAIGGCIGTLLVSFAGAPFGTVVISPVLGFLIGSFAAAFIKPNVVWYAAFNALSEALEDPGLDLERRICEYRSPQHVAPLMRDARAVLTTAARRVVLAERTIEKMRFDRNYTAADLRAAIDALFRIDSDFERTLEYATDFGLNDGDRKLYFTKAIRELNEVDADSNT